MLCEKCGKKNVDGAKFCNSCGVPMFSKGAPLANKNIQGEIETKRKQIANLNNFQIIAIIICIILGIMTASFGMTNLSRLIIPILIVTVAIFVTYFSIERDKKRLDTEINELNAKFNK